MRIFEFDTTAPEETDAQAEGIASLLTVLNTVIAQAKNEDTEPQISTPALINMVSNTGVLFDYNALMNAHENNPAVGNLISNFSKETVDLVGSAEDEMDSTSVGDPQNSGEAVARIAKRVATRDIG